MKTPFVPSFSALRPLRPIVVVTLGLLSLACGGCLRVGADLGAVRDAAQSAVTAGGRWQEQIELSVGGVSFALARTVGAFGELEPEARAVLASARSVEVGVYGYHGRRDAVSPAGLIEAATREMETRGWLRTVAVIDGHDTVAVFTEKNLDVDAPVRLCVMVFDGEELVLASMRADLEPLAALALAESHKHWRWDA